MVKGSGGVVVNDVVDAESDWFCYIMRKEKYCRAYFGELKMEAF